MMTRWSKRRQLGERSQAFRFNCKGIYFFFFFFFFFLCFPFNALNGQVGRLVLFLFLFFFFFSAFHLTY